MEIQNEVTEKPTKEKPQHVVVRNTADYQRMKLEKLMKNPDKPVLIPERPKERGSPHVPDFVRNVMGSSAGAGSGEFHVYRHLRRKEYARQKYMQEKAGKERENEEYRNRLEQNKLLAEERTAKKRAKRLKKKKKQKAAAKKPKLNKESSSEQTEESSNDGDDEETEAKEKSEIIQEDQEGNSKDMTPKSQDTRESEDTNENISSDISAKELINELGESSEIDNTSKQPGET